ncbi:hypothetical protein CEXT_173881 [Caerostris extrusa]|uniref:Uncharacterized protein n=1 Tax=Caerostris extrusa TaxID=172846 RepID=A0AAV4QE89_CAEEX|nr:hypothetical protein CEXT_173881 [Caerostris extrusa]
MRMFLCGCLSEARVLRWFGKRGRQGRDTDGRSRADRSDAVIRRSLFCAVGKNAGAHVMDVAKEENFTPANPINFAKQFSFPSSNENCSFSFDTFFLHDTLLVI